MAIELKSSGFLSELGTRARANALAEGAILTRADGKRLEFRDEAWVGLLEAARRYGHWQPQGTAAPNVKGAGVVFAFENWGGQYIKSGEATPWVGARDAANLGAAVWQLAELFDTAGQMSSLASTDSLGLGQLIR